MLDIIKLLIENPENILKILVISFILYLFKDLYNYTKLYCNWINDFKNNTRNCAYGNGNINQPHLTLKNPRFFIEWMCPSLPDKEHPGLTVLQVALIKLQFFEDTIYKWYDGPLYFEEFAISSNGNFKNYYDNLCSSKKIQHRWLYEMIIKYLIKNIRKFISYLKSFKIPEKNLYYKWNLERYKKHHKIISYIRTKYRNYRAKIKLKKHNKKIINKFWGYR